jgi:hypothetical protein
VIRTRMKGGGRDTHFTGIRNAAGHAADYSLMKLA